MLICMSRSIEDLEPNLGNTEVNGHLALPSMEARFSSRCIKINQFIYNLYIIEIRLHLVWLRCNELQEFCVLNQVL